MSEQKPERIAASEDSATKRPWISPDLRTMQAGAAEAGPNPNANEGQFAFGS